MDPVQLPLLPSHEEGTCYLFVPGLQEDEIKGVEFQVDWDRAVLDVFLYEEEDENRELEGVRIPVMIDEDRMGMVRDMTQLYVTEPRTISPKKVGEDDYVLLKEEFEEWKQQHT